ncbi:MAG: 6-phosphogluconolactonase [Gemmatimonadales bacterium]
MRRRGVHRPEPRGPAPSGDGAGLKAERRADEGDRSLPGPRWAGGAVVDRFAARAAEAIAASGRFTVALAGGSTPRAAYRLLATDIFVRRVDWARVQVLWGDERCVPPDDPRSNYRMAREALLDRVPIPPGNIHRILGEDEPPQAVAEYERLLRDLLGGNQGLDLILLGLGDDGHTGSLFPGQAALREKARWVVADYVAAAAMWRITLTPVVINAARDVSFIVSGAAKAECLREVIKGPFAPQSLPAQIVDPAPGHLTWLVDEAAASQLR